MLLYDGNRVMLFRTALALMELYGAGLYEKLHVENLIYIIHLCLKAM